MQPQPSTTTTQHGQYVHDTSGKPACSCCNTTRAANGDELFACDRCGSAYYCSIEHQNFHWKRHKPHCRPLADSRQAALLSASLATRATSDDDSSSGIASTSSSSLRRPRPILRASHASTMASDDIASRLMLPPENSVANAGSGVSSSGNVAFSSILASAAPGQVLSTGPSGGAGVSALQLAPASASTTASLLAALQQQMAATTAQQAPLTTLATPAGLGQAELLQQSYLSGTNPMLFNLASLDNNSLMQLAQLVNVPQPMITGVPLPMSAVPNSTQPELPSLIGLPSIQSQIAAYHAAYAASSAAVAAAAAAATRNAFPSMADPSSTPSASTLGLFPAPASTLVVNAVPQPIQQQHHPSPSAATRGPVFELGAADAAAIKSHVARHGTHSAAASTSSSHARTPPRPRAAAVRKHPESPIANRMDTTLDEPRPSTSSAASYAGSTRKRGTPTPEEIRALSLSGQVVRPSHHQPPRQQQQLLRGASNSPAARPVPAPAVMNEEDDDELQVVKEMVTRKYKDHSKNIVYDVTLHDHQRNLVNHGHMINFHQALFLRIRYIAEHVIHSLNEYGWAVVDNFFGEQRCRTVAKEMEKLYKSGYFTEGQVMEGKATPGQRPQVSDIRSDYIYWYNGSTDGPGETNTIRLLISLVDSVILHFNGRIGDHKIGGRSRAMLAIYPARGSRYIRHVDNPAKDGRLITVIYYGNENWNINEHGGALRLYPETSQVPMDIDPKADRLIFFWSDRRNPHEVMPVFRHRFAITIWYMDREERMDLLRKQGDLPSSGKAAGVAVKKIKQEPEDEEAVAVEENIKGLVDDSEVAAAFAAADVLGGSSETGRASFSGSAAPRSTFSGPALRSTHQSGRRQAPTIEREADDTPMAGHSSAPNNLQAFALRRTAREDDIKSESSDSENECRLVVDEDFNDEESSIAPSQQTPQPRMGGAVDHDEEDDLDEPPSKKTSPEQIYEI